MKDVFITIRVTKEEKQSILKDSVKAGFDSVSTYMLWLYRTNSNTK